MSTVVLVIHILIGIALIGVVLVQRSEGGGLGVGGGTMGGFMTARGSANLMTRTTGILFAAFLLTSLGLALLDNSAARKASVFDTLPVTAPVTAPAAPATAPTTAPAAPATDASGKAAPTQIPNGQ